MQKHKLIATTHYVVISEEDIKYTHTTAQVTIQNRTDIELKKIAEECTLFLTYTMPNGKKITIKKEEIIFDEAIATVTQPAETPYTREKNTILLAYISSKNYEAPCEIKGQFLNPHDASTPGRVFTIAVLPQDNLKGYASIKLATKGKEFILTLTQHEENTTPYCQAILSIPANHIPKEATPLIENIRFGAVETPVWKAKL